MYYEDERKALNLIGSSMADDSDVKIKKCWKWLDGVTLVTLKTNRKEYDLVCALLKQSVKQYYDLLDGWSEYK